MAIVLLGTVWLNAQAPDGSWSDRLKLKAATMVATPSKTITYTTTSSGRRIGTVLPGADLKWQVSCPVSSPEQARWLADHVGVLVCARSHWGDRVFGVYDKLPQNRARYPRIADVTIELAELTYPDGV